MLNRGTNSGSEMIRKKLLVTGAKILLWCAFTAVEAVIIGFPNDRKC